MNNNLMLMIKGLMGKATPKQIVMEYIKSNNMGNNAVVKNLTQMAENNDTKGLNNFAKNICEGKGLNYQNEMTNFNKSLK